MAKKKVLKLAFIGGGGIARQHADYFSRYDDVNIAAVADISDDCLKHWKDALEVPGYTAYQEMLQEIKPDLVSICTPNFLHYKPSLDAMKAGAHLFIEKPMAMNSRECRNIISQSRKLNRKISIGFQHRFEPRVQFISQAIAEGRFGNILQSRVYYHRRRGFPNWGVFGQKAQQGGGCLIDIGVHALEMCWYTVGRPQPVAVSGNVWAHIGNDPKKAKNVACQWPGWDTEAFDVEDLAIGQIRFGDGSIMTLECSFAMHHEEEGMNFTIRGEKAGAQLDPLKIYTDDYGHMVNIEPSFIPETDIWETKIRGVIDHMLHNGPNLAPAEDGLAVQQILDGIYRSARTGREVAVR